MESHRTPSAWGLISCAPIAVFVFCIALTDIEASVRWRVDGNACAVQAGTDFLANTIGGLTLYYTNGPATANCTVPLQFGELDITSGSGYRLDYASLWYVLGGNSNETVDVTLWAHDFDADDYCECDSDTRSGAAGFFNVTTSYAGDADSDGCDDCPGAVPSTCSLSVSTTLSTATAGTNVLTLRMVTLYDI
jgi:hypothetical protein